MQRFHDKVDSSTGPDACWPWTAAKSRTGYGAFRLAGKTVTASRYAYTLAHGDPGALYVCHTCDNPACCNPAHLFLGTNQDNQLDASSKGRKPGKLTPEKRRHIAKQHAAGWPKAALARLYGVKVEAINRAIAA